MDDKKTEPQSIEAESPDSIVDLDLLTERIWYDLEEHDDRARVRKVLVDLLPTYERARISTFVPILIRRQAIEILRPRPN